MTQSPETATEVKACCATAYQDDVVALALGESYHPGGLALTRRLAAAVGLSRGQRVLDVASGPGTTALLLAREHGVQVDGVDLGVQSVERAAAAADQAGLVEQVRFGVADAEGIPFDDGAFDALVCECAFCTFLSKEDAAREIARVLRPGGRVGITDVTVERARLTPELTSLAGWVACIADARPAEEYAEILAGAGLRTVVVERHDEALAAMVEQIEARLVALRLAAGSSRALTAVDWDGALLMTRVVRTAVADRIAGYALLVAEKPLEG